MNVAQHPHAASMADPMPPPPGPPNGAYAHHMVAQSPGGPQGAQNKMELMNAIPLQQHQQQHQQQHMQPPPQGQQGPPPPQHPQQQQQQPPQQQQQQPQGGPPGQAGPQPGRACERCRKTGRTCEPREGALACVGCNASRVACSLVGEIQGTTGTRRASPTKRPTNNHNANSNTSNNNKKRARSSTGPDAWEDGGDDQQQQQQPQPQHVMSGHPLAPVPMSDGNAHAMMTLGIPQQQQQQHPKRRRTDDAEDTDIEEIREVIRDINSMHGEIGRKLNRLTKLWERKYGQAP